MKIESCPPGFEPALDLANMSAEDILALAELSTEEIQSRVDIDAIMANQHKRFKEDLVEVYKRVTMQSFVYEGMSGCMDIAFKTDRVALAAAAMREAADYFEKNSEEYKYL